MIFLGEIQISPLDQKEGVLKLVFKAKKCFILEILGENASIAGGPPACPGPSIDRHRDAHVRASREGPATHSPL